MKPLGSFREVLTVLVFLAGGLSYLPNLSWLAWVALAVGLPFLIKRTFESLRQGDLDVDFLMLLAAVGAAVVNQPGDAAILLFLFNLSSVMEERAMSRTKDAISSLVKLRPSEAILVRDGTDKTVPVESLAVGDIVRVPSFTSVPVDGTVVEGLSSVNQASITGESVPVSVEKGTNVIGGTQNLDGPLLISVRTVVGDSTLDRIVALVQEAQTNKASGERISQWFGQRYTWFVLVAFAISLAVRLFVLNQPLMAATYTSVVLLVALSPCALVISTPATTLSALAWAARNGLLIRGGEFIERSGEVNAVAFDKTGTVTSGRPKLRCVCVCSHEEGDSATEDQCYSGAGEPSARVREVVALAAALEKYAAHPMAEAIRRAAVQWPEPEPMVSDHRVIPGLGIEGITASGPIRLGQIRLWEEANVQVPAYVQSHVTEWQGEGLGIVVMDSPLGFAVLAFEDEMRPETPAVLEQLRSMGVTHLAMLSGDSPAAVSRLAGMLKLDEVQGGLMPGQKSGRIAELGKEHRVMMVGDGVNDGPALSAAYVGVAMGGLGSDVALNSADVVLMRDRLDALPELIELGRKTRRTITANLVFAGGVIVALTVSSFIIRLPLPVAVIGHEGSTVLVILNGLRLLRGPGLSPRK